MLSPLAILIGTDSTRRLAESAGPRAPKVYGKRR
jgi:hypothetical protein